MTATFPNTFLPTVERESTCKNQHYFTCKDQHYFTGTEDLLIPTTWWNQDKE